MMLSELLKEEAQYVLAPLGLLPGASLLEVVAAANRQGRRLAIRVGAVDLPPQRVAKVLSEYGHMEFVEALVALARDEGRGVVAIVGEDDYLAILPRDFEIIDAERGLLGAIMKVSPELWLAFLKSEEAQGAIVREAARIARDRLLALEGVRDTIGPHAKEISELEEAWEVLSRVLDAWGE